MTFNSDDKVAPLPDAVAVTVKDGLLAALCCTRPIVASPFTSTRRDLQWCTPCNGYHIPQPTPQSEESLHYAALSDLHPDYPASRPSAATEDKCPKCGSDKKGVRRNVYCEADRYGSAECNARWHDPAPAATPEPQNTPEAIQHHENLAAPESPTPPLEMADEVADKEFWSALKDAKKLAGEIYGEDDNLATNNIIQDVLLHQRKLAAAPPVEVQPSLKDIQRLFRIFADSYFEEERKGQEVRLTAAQMLSRERGGGK